MFKPGDLVNPYDRRTRITETETVGVVTIDPPLTTCASGPSYRVFWLREPTSTYDKCGITKDGMYHECGLRLFTPKAGVPSESHHHE